MKLDLGCGKNKREGFLGVDSLPFEGVDIVLDLMKLKPGVEEWRSLLKPTVKNLESFELWPWEENSIEEVHSSHSLEHLNALERTFFWNELYRVLKKDGKAQIIVPHHASGRAYGDLTHTFPAVVEFSFFYLDKAWREANAPHNALVCDLHAQWGYSIAAPWNSRSQETQTFAVNHYREVAQDLVATVTKR